MNKPHDCCHQHTSPSHQKDTGSHAICVSLVPIFNHLEWDQMKEIAQMTRSRTFKKGEYIYQPGEAADSLYIVNTGLVRIFRLTESGKEQLVRFLRPGDFMGELAVFSTSIHEAFAEASKDTTICMLTKADMQEILNKYPAISMKIMEEFSNRLEKSEKQTTLVATEKVETRLALFLAELMDPDSHEVILPMSKKDLASYLGTTPETLSRKLSSLQDRGLIHQVTNKRMVVKDVDELLLV